MLGLVLRVIRVIDLAHVAFFMREMGYRVTDQFVEQLSDFIATLK